MGLFSRSKEAVDGLRADDVPFSAIRRSPRSTNPSGRATRSVRAGAGESSSPLDPADAAKSRARHRLIGAVALALAAIVFVPMLFERAPVPTNDDILLQIPDRDSPFEARRGVPDASRGPLKASPEQPIVPSPPVVAALQPPPPAPATKPIVESPVESPVNATTAKAADPVEARTIEPKAPEKGATRPAVEKPVDPVSRATVPVDDPKALAALAGKPAPAAEATNGRSFVVQVATFSMPDKARELHDRLVANGLRSYTESVSTRQGLWTRVRLGPYPSREAADSAQRKLKSMKLDGSVMPL